MTQEEFRAKCLEAIKPWYDPEQDGPLLIAMRDQTSYSLKLKTWEEPFPEYASAIGEWPKHHHGNEYAQFTQFTSHSIGDLAKYAEELHRVRQEEPDEEPEPFREGLVWNCR